MLRIKNLESGYGNLKVLRHISIHVRTGEIVTIIGANGAGKTTLLKTIAGLIKSRAGEIMFENTDISHIAPEHIVFSGCSLVPEGRQVFAPMTVRENLLLGGYVQYRRKKKNEVDSDLEQVLELFPILKERQAQLAGTLSGGEQQMLAIGRAMMARPKLIMMDEPSMGLAPLIVKELFGILRAVNEKEHVSMLVVEQNAAMALELADHAYLIETGRIVLSGTSDEIKKDDAVRRSYLGY